MFILAVALALALAQSPAVQNQSDSNVPASFPSKPAERDATDWRDPANIRKVEKGIRPPEVISNVEPDFSKEARKRKISGVTVVQLIVDVHGDPQDVHVLKSMAEIVSKKQRSAALSLDQKALEAVRQYRFSPARDGDKPVPVKVNVEVNWRIY